MSQLFDPIPSNTSEQILCCYVNATSKIQVVRITNIPGWYFERVVFPGQRLLFEAMIEAQLEIHCGMMASAILADTIPCDRLQIASELAADFEIEIVPRGLDTPKEPVAVTSAATLDNIQ